MRQTAELRGVNDGARDVQPTRRQVLASLAPLGAAGTGGCLDRARTVFGWQSSGQIRLQIKTVPTDADPYAPRIARRVAEWFRTAGLDAHVLPVSQTELRRQVLLNQEFDVFVARTPSLFSTPDELYSLLHSAGAARPGWQNPFGYTNLEVDRLLETQRRAAGSERREAVSDLQRVVARTHPFDVAGFADRIRAVRDDRFAGWTDADLTTPLGYLSLERDRSDGSQSNGASEAVALRLVTADRRVTENLNPLSLAFRDYEQVTGLLYDPLSRVVDGEFEPWLAAEWTFDEDSERPRASVELRSDLGWHDGESLTAADVAFTYAFLTDTTLGTGDEAVPAPRFQGRVGLVEDVQAIDDRTALFSFTECSRDVARRAFTVPILPTHEWEETTAPADIGGIDVGSGVTEALVTDGIPPVGSGPLSFVENTPSESVTLERYDDHFLHRDSESAYGADFDRFELRAVGSDTAAVEVVSEGSADATASSLGAGLVPRIGRAADLTLDVEPQAALYVVGYNTRREPLSNPRFRDVLGRLVDKQSLVGAVFEEYATAGVSPLTGTEWLPADLRWNGADPVTPFLGNGGDVDRARARDAFREAGYQYEDGRLVRR